MGGASGFRIGLNIIRRVVLSADSSQPFISPASYAVVIAGLPSFVISAGMPTIVINRLRSKHVGSKEVSA